MKKTRSFVLLTAFLVVSLLLSALPGAVSAATLDPAPVVEAGMCALPASILASVLPSVNCWWENGVRKCQVCWYSRLRRRTLCYVRNA